MWLQRRRRPDGRLAGRVGSMTGRNENLPPWPGPGLSLTRPRSTSSSVPTGLVNHDRCCRNPVAYLLVDRPPPGRGQRDVAVPVAAGLAQPQLEQDVAVGGRIAGRGGHLGPEVGVAHGEATAHDRELPTGSVVVLDTVVEGEPSPLPEIPPLGRGRSMKRNSPGPARIGVTGCTRGTPDRRTVARYAGAAVNLPAPKRASSGSRVANSPHLIAWGDPGSGTVMSFTTTSSAAATPGPRTRRDAVR